MRINDEKFTRILALDYGAKRIGIALCDPLLTFAYPFKTIQNDNKIWNELSSLIEEKAVQKIILGYPYKESGEPTEISKKIKKFRDELENRFKLEVILWDERYTSSIAEEMMLESVNKKSKRRDKGIIDRNAAAIILQEYLNELQLKE